MNFVEMRSIYKAFGAVRALDGADLSVESGEILGLVGDNAAGKSTLMKMLSGAYTPDEGSIFIDGKQCHISNPEDARALGIEMVYQDLALADNLDVTGNIFMGRELYSGFMRFLSRKEMDAKTRKLIGRLGIDISDVRQLVQNLSGGQRQSVAIGRAMAFNARLVIMDEPTASLSPESAEKVLDVIRQLKAHGIAVVLINHRTEEVKRVSDRVVVMRHGKVYDA
jgi:ABC-type sugar transport system ATPase subunit